MSFESIELREVCAVACAAAVAAPPSVPRLKVGVAAKAGRVPVRPKAVFPIEPPAWKGEPRAAMVEL